jgi:Holliday junction resolvasome RuvABC DNA-binding subunit
VLAAAYVKGAEKHTATTTKALTKADIESLFAAHAITEAQAVEMLTKLGFDHTEAQLVTSQVNLKRTIANTNSAISRIRTLTIGRKLSKADAAAALHTLGVDASEASQMIGVWELEQAATFRPLTAAQITAAWSKGILDQSEALTELAAIGYTAFDAWVILSEKNGSPLPGKPPRGSGPT